MCYNITQNHRMAMTNLLARSETKANMFCLFYSFVVKPFHVLTKKIVVFMQFKVLKRGCWEKIHFRKSQTHPDTRNESNLLSSPWIQHFRPSSTSKGGLDAHLSHLPEDGVLACEANDLHRRKYSALNYGLATSSGHYLPYYTDKWLRFWW